MKIKTNYKDNCFIFLICILLVSFGVNVYQSFKTSYLKTIVNDDIYEKIEEIRYRNESIINTLDGCIKASKITNEDLVTLYKNYSIIADVETELWESYIEGKVELSLLSKSKLKNIESVYVNEIYWDIEGFIYSYLIDDLRENLSGIELTGQTLDDFSTLLYLSQDLNQYYINFYNKNYKGLDEIQRSKKMIKNNIWVEMIEGIQKVTEKYIDYPFIYGGEEIQIQSSTVTE